MARRALEISAAGAHHLLLRGPPGCGKSMLARRLPTILPSMSFDEALAAARIRSAAGLEPATALARTRPFRAPHHSVTVAGLVGDRTLRPGEVSLAHAGVLFLDEAAEFRRSVLEVLREPLEEQVVRITRAEGSICYPAALTLVLATNPCPCGRRGSPLPCTCTDRDVCRYQRRISGPILDRVDLHVDLSPVGEQELLHRGPGEPSSAVRARVEDARKRAETRGQPFPNGQLSTHDVERFAPLDPQTREILARGMRKHLLTARATHGIRKVARTIADLAGSDMVEPHHLTEALAYRPQAHGP